MVRQERSMCSAMRLRKPVKGWRSSCSWAVGVDEVDAMNCVPTGAGCVVETGVSGCAPMGEGVAGCVPIAAGAGCFICSA